MAFGLAALAGGLLGGLAGGQGSKTRQSSTVKVAPASSLEIAGAQTAEQNLDLLQRLIGSTGLDVQTQRDATQSQQDLIKRLQELSQTGLIPNQQQTNIANQFTQQAFAPQQQALNFQFRGLEEQAARQAGQLGRGSADPILLAKLAQQQVDAQQMLESQKTAASSQFALGLPQQQLQLQQQAVQLQSGLASQALQNRQALISLGSSIAGQGQNFRAGTASRDTLQTSGGGLGGFLTGAIGGAASGLNLFNAFNKMGSTT